MAVHCEEYQSLLQLLRERCRNRPCRLIGIDGAMQTGKSPLAERLAADLSGQAIHCDDHHPPTGYPYVAELDIEAMRVILSAPGPSPVIIDAICLLGVLDRLACTADCLVYVFPQDLCAIENDWFEDEIPLEQVLRDLGSDSGGALDREIATYTKTRRPQDLADVTFRWRPMGAGGGGAVDG